MQGGIGTHDWLTTVSIQMWVGVKERVFATNVFHEHFTVIESRQVCV